MTTTAEALEVMAMVAVCHHRTAPRMDDPQAAIVKATVWAELFTDPYQLELPDLIAGVKKRAQSHADAPEPAEIIEAARGIRLERRQRQEPEEREAIEDARDAELEARNRDRLAAMIEPVAAAKSIGANHA